ncbi:MAG: hypothetical protein H8E66_02445 [Planctomycetes bacterium]|nr:hypothetical protein [Planctomycetota bacterium]
MKYHSLSLLLLAVSGSLLYPSIASAQAEADYVSYASELADVYSRLSELESQQNESAYQTSEKEDYWPSTALLETDGRPGWLAQVDLLYWAVRNPATQYGITDIGGVQDRGAVGDILSITPEYEAGYRIAFGKRLGHCVAGPEITFRFTDFDQQITERRIGSLRASFISSDNSENNDSDDAVNDITPDDRATSATANYDFSYNAYDLEIAQSLITTEHLTLRMGGTGRVMDLEQGFDVTYTGGDFQVPYRGFETSDYVGGGLLLGTELKWRVTNRLTLGMGAKAGAMFGTFDTRLFLPDDEPGVPTDVRSSERRMSTVLEMNVGLNYRRPWRRFLLTGAAGYEMTQLLDFSDRRVFSDSHIEGQNSHLIGNVSLDGLYARAGVDF